MYLGGGSLEAALWPPLLLEAGPEDEVKFVSTTSEALEALDKVERPCRE